MDMGCSAELTGIWKDDDDEEVLATDDGRRQGRSLKTERDDGILSLFFSAKYTRRFYRYAGLLTSGGSMPF